MDCQILKNQDRGQKSVVESSTRIGRRGRSVNQKRHPEFQLQCEP